jgi:hypothetical protein
MEKIHIKVTYPRVERGKYCRKKVYTNYLENTIFYQNLVVPYR